MDETLKRKKFESDRRIQLLKRKQFESDRRIQFWMDCMLVQQRLDSAAYAVVQTNIALEHFDKLIEKK